MSLKPNRPANPRAVRLISDADAIIFGPGDLYTSTIPNLLVKGIAAAIKKSRAAKIAITNLMTKHGQTDKFKASDFVQVLKAYVGPINAAIINAKRPTDYWLARHQKERSEFVEPDTASLKRAKVRVVAEPLLSENVFHKNNGDVLKRSFLRHDSEKLAQLIWKLI